MVELPKRNHGVKGWCERRRSIFHVEIARPGEGKTGTDHLRGNGMACQALSLRSPSKFYVSSRQCRPQLFGLSLSSSRSSIFCKERNAHRGENDVGGFISKPPRSLKLKSIPASGVVGAATSSPNELGSDYQCRPALRLAKHYSVREAKLDEELWAAAWIRAESYCEEQRYLRYIESYKKKFAEQEFDALKRRLLGKYGQSVRCICLVAVSGRSSLNNTMNGTQSATLLERVVGTLDLSVRQLSQGETFPGVGGFCKLPFRSEIQN